MGVVNLFCAPASKPRGVAEDVAASGVPQFHSSSDDLCRGLTERSCDKTTHIGSNGSGKHLCIKNK